MGAFLFRGSAGSPTSTAPALLVTFVQNRFTCSSPRIPFSVSTASSTYTTFNCWPSWQKRRVLQISTQVMGVFQQWFAQYDPVQVAEFVHLRRNAANSYLHHRIGPDQRRWRHPVSIEVPGSCWWCCPGRLPLSSIWYGTWFEHWFCHCRLVGLYSPWFDGTYLLFGANTL